MPQQEPDWLKQMAVPVQGGRPLPDGSVVFNLPPDPMKVRAENRADANDARNEAKDTFRTLTPEEVAAQGLPAGGVYQMNGMGQVNTIKAAPESGQNPSDAKVTAAQNVRRQLTQMREIYDRSFKGMSPLEYLPSDDKKRFQAIARTMRADLKPLIRGPGEGTFTEGDQKLLDELIPNPDEFDAYNEQIFNELDARINATLQQYGRQEASAAPAGGGDGLPSTPVTPEESARIWGEPMYDAQGNPVGADYTGDSLYDAQGNFVSLNVRVTDDSQPLRNFDPNADPRVAKLADEWERQYGQAGLGRLANAGGTLGLADEIAGVFTAAGKTLQGDFNYGDNYALFRDVERELQRRARERTGTLGTAAELLGGGGALRTLGSGAVSVGRAALEGGTVGGIAGFGSGEGAQDSLVNAGVGAVGGAALGGALQKFANRTGGGTPGGGGPRVEPDAASIVSTGKAENVPVMTSDVRRPRTWFGNWLQGTGEKLPVVGTGGMRAAQQESRVAMIERLADDYGKAPATIDDVTADFMKTRGKEIAKFTQQKREVFGGLAGAPPPVAQNSLDTLDKAIGRYGAQETFSGLTSKLQGWRNDLAKARSIDDVEALRKSIGDTFNDESLKSTSSAMRDIVNGPDGLYASIKKDMAGYIRSNSGEPALNKWNAANAKLSDFADDLGKNTVKRVLSKGEATPEEAAALLFSKKPSDVKALFANLSLEGQKRARAVVVQKLVDDAGGINELSTAKFRTGLQKSADAFGVIFPKAEAERLTGMLRLLQATRRAEQASVTTPTGQSTLPFAGATGVGFLAGDWFGAAGVGSLTAASFRVYESKAMRNLLMALNKTKAGSKAEQNVLASIQRVASANVSNVVNLPQTMRVGASPMPLAAQEQNTRADTTTTAPGPQ